MPEILSVSAIEQRLPVWCALADLFLDTELQAQDFDRLAVTLGQSGFPLIELRRILEDEVAPAFGGNLMSIAGEWAGWPVEVVRDQILEHMAGQAGRRRWTTARALKMIAADWSQVERRLQEQGRGR